MSSVKTARKRVLTVTKDAALEVAFSLMAGSWKVDAAQSADEAIRMGPESYSAVLIDFKTTTRGLEEAEVIRSRFPELKCLLIGDQEDTTSPVSILLRPFSVEQLRQALARLDQEREAEAAPTSLQLEPTAEKEPEAELEATPETEPESAVPASPEPAPSPEIVEDSVETVVVQEERVARPSTTPTEVEIEEPAEAVEAPRAVVPPWDAGEAFHEALEKTTGWLRKFKRPKQLDTIEEEVGQPLIEPEFTLADRLDAALESLREIRRLVLEVPALSSQEGFSMVIAEEISTRVKSSTVAIYLLGQDDIFAVQGQVGLSPAEERMTVNRDHPVISKVCSTLKPVFVERIDSVQGFVAGLAGARDGKLIACPLADGKEIHGVAIVSGEALTGEDVARLERLCQEASTGLTITHMLSMLST